jgi:two-component system, chemotaxis family, chemotaxis protein CheY
MDLTHFSAVVADDHRVCRIIIREVLKSAGMDDIREASDGAEAYQRVCERPPDILFLDLEMPCDGLSTLRKIRASNHSHIRELGIIMATAHTSRDRIVALRDAGASEVLTKPLTVSKLLGRVQSVLYFPRPFVRAEGYSGPDRRRSLDPRYSGPRRRATDPPLDESDELDIDVA